MSFQTRERLKKSKNSPALCPHGEPGQIPASMVNVSVSHVAWWELEEAEPPQPVPLALLCHCHSPFAPLLLSYPASTLSPALGAGNWGSIKKTELVRLSNKDYLCISPVSAKVVVETLCLTPHEYRTVEYFLSRRTEYNLMHF